VTVQTTYTEADLYGYVQKERHLKRSLRAIAEDFGEPIKHSDIQRILQGVYPVSPEKRTALGLPATAPAPVCTACGQVHAIDRACVLRVTVRAQPKARTTWRSLWDIPTDELRQMLENRKEV
jgi:hypothetical protein